MPQFVQSILNEKLLTSDFKFQPFDFSHPRLMPELPEVETIRRGLAEKLVGHKITDIDIRAPKLFIGDSSQLIGQKVLELERRAKILIWKLSDCYLLTHLKMTGQLIFVPKQALGTKNLELDKQGLGTSFQETSYQSQIPSSNQSLVPSSQSPTSSDWLIGGHPDKVYGLDLPHKHTHIVVTFDHGTLYYNDLRKFGWLKVLFGDEALKKEVVHIGPEYTWPEFTYQYFQDELAKRRVTIKQILLDQTFIAGIGNIYADESLFCAQISPTKKANQLNKGETKKLFCCIPKVFNLALQHGGTSSRDYRQSDGTLGTYLKIANVYKREGLPCNVCGRPIVRIKISGRSSHFCPHCQK